MLEDLGKKLDERNELLEDIKANTSVLTSFVAGQREHNQWRTNRQNSEGTTDECELQLLPD